MSNKLTEADTYVESLNEIYTFLNDFCKCVTLFECISSPRFFFFCLPAFQDSATTNPHL